jgi:hypothetical protein
MITAYIDFFLDDHHGHHHLLELVVHIGTKMPHHQGHQYRDGHDDEQL